MRFSTLTKGPMAAQVCGPGGKKEGEGGGGRGERKGVLHNSPVLRPSVWCCCRGRTGKKRKKRGEKGGRETCSTFYDHSNLHSFEKKRGKRGGNFCR